MAESTIALLIMAVVIVVFVVNRLPVGVVAIAAAVSLWATGLLELEDALRGFAASDGGHDCCTHESGAVGVADANGVCRKCRVDVGADGQSRERSCIGRVP